MLLFIFIVLYNAKIIEEEAALEKSNWLLN